MRKKKPSEYYTKWKKGKFFVKTEMQSMHITHEERSNKRSCWTWPMQHPQVKLNRTEIELSMIRSSDDYNYAFGLSLKEATNSAEFTEFLN